MKIKCWAAKGSEFKVGQEYVASKKTYAPGYNVRAIDSDNPFFGFHMSNDLVVSTRDGRYQFQQVED
ncbi:hypothetical protein [Pectobacterium parmentieri]|uniref:hypothetical protein n=1 Tax=Pectobacterium parmentieri TaxID=1905730 RepID=UPI000D60E8AD|nr:hypothetical protein [Pectobacterium parmentieri]PWD66527.1 hypothetical protein DF211_01880 [Pectobacterium parmentieri]